MQIHPTTRNLLHKLQSLWRKQRPRSPNKIKKKTSSPSSSTKWLELSEMEIQAQLKQVFDIMDANGDGKISPSELEQLMLSLGHDKSTASTEAEGMVRVADVDGDGRVDLEEFMQALGGDQLRSLCTSRKDLEEAFLVFDEDRNGFISAKELRRVLEGLGLGKCSVRECREMIRRFDRNGDGMVDFEEFRSLMTTSTRLGS